MVTWALTPTPWCVQQHHPIGPITQPTSTMMNRPPRVPSGTRWTGQCCTNANESNNRCGWHLHQPCRRRHQVLQWTGQHQHQRQQANISATPTPAQAPTPSSTATTTTHPTTMPRHRNVHGSNSNITVPSDCQPANNATTRGWTAAAAAAPLMTYNEYHYKQMNSPEHVHNKHGWRQTHKTANMGENECRWWRLHGEHPTPALARHRSTTGTVSTEHDAGKTRENANELRGERPAPAPAWHRLTARTISAPNTVNGRTPSRMWTIYTANTPHQHQRNANRPLTPSQCRIQQMGKLPQECQWVECQHPHLMSMSQTTNMLTGMNMTPASAFFLFSLPFPTATSAAPVVMLVASSDDETQWPHDRAQICAWRWWYFYNILWAAGSPPCRHCTLILSVQCWPFFL